MLKDFEIQKRAENFRCDQKLLTTRYLEKIDNADPRKLKSVYNYQLQEKKDHRIFEDAARQEIQAQRFDRTPAVDA